MQPRQAHKNYHIFASCGGPSNIDDNCILVATACERFDSGDYDVGSSSSGRTSVVVGLFKRHLEGQIHIWPTSTEASAVPFPRFFGKLCKICTQVLHGVVHDCGVRHF
jgi:hypothetical protein